MKKIFIVLIFFSILISLISCSSKNVGQNSLIEKSERRLAPDFTLSTLDGGVVQLSNFKGKVILIDFWAEWCGPCKIATPTIIKMYEKYNDKDLVVFGINLDDKKDLDKAINYVKEKDIKYYILIDGFSVAQKYNVTGIPKFVLIDKKGYIAAELVGAREDLENLLDANIKSLLNE